MPHRAATTENAVCRLFFWNVTGALIRWIFVRLFVKPCVAPMVAYQTTAEMSSTGETVLEDDIGSVSRLCHGGPWKQPAGFHGGLGLRTSIIGSSNSSVLKT